MKKRFAPSAFFQRRAAEHKDVSDLFVRKFAVAQKIEPVADSEGDGRLRFVISTASVDREGDTISVDGWKLDNYRKNPVVLWCHDYHSVPMGKAESIRIENGNLVSVAKFAKDLDPFINLCYELYRGGYMSAVSVGFDPIRWEFVEQREDGQKRGVDFREQELLEYSCVPVPANPEALIQARALGHIDTTPMKTWASERLDSLGDSDAAYRMENGILIPKGLLEALFKTSSGEDAPTVSLPESFEAEPEAEAETETQPETPPETESEPPAEPEAEAETETPSPEVAERSTPRGAGWTDFEHHQRGADGAESAVVWAGVAHAMRALIEGKGGAQSPKLYAHLAGHYREDFDTEPPEWRHVEGAVLKHYPDVFVFDLETGVLSALSAVERAERDIRAALKGVLKTVESIGQTSGFAVKAGGAIRGLLEDKDITVVQREGGGNVNGNGHQAMGCATISEVTEFLKAEAPALARECIAAELAQARGRVD